MTLTTRRARIEDAAAITRIYNQGIAERIATFETEPRTTEQIAALLSERGDRYPTIVVEDAGAVVAFAWASAYRARSCYDGVADHGVYVAHGARGRGAGLVALTALAETYTQLGFWKLLSRIFPENGASVRLHEKAGFRVVGTYVRHAKLDGAWRDTVIVEKLLGDAAQGATTPRAGVAPVER